jgi:hypothetical protein
MESPHSSFRDDRIAGVWIMTIHTPAIGGLGNSGKYSTGEGIDCFACNSLLQRIGIHSDIDITGYYNIVWMPG